MSHKPKTGLKKLVMLFLIAFGSLPVSAQLQVQSNVGLTNLMTALIGGGLTVSNVTLNCDTGAYGTFGNGNSTNLGMNNGILLTSGSVYNSLGPDIGGGSLTACPGTSANDPELMSIDPLATNDPCILEFDIVPTCNQLTLRFVFGSEEYPVFVGSSFNDAFGFFVSGPNPLGGNYTNVNIATIPNGTPVSINTVNNGTSNTGPCTNCAFYIDNTNGPTIQYNGLTTVLTVNLALTPCQTYHFKIAIADAGDCSLDSGVFVDYLSCSTSLQLTPAAVPASCNMCDGVASVTASGGTPPYNYQWLPSGGNSSQATNLCPGTYSVIVSDNTGCGPSDTATVTVTSGNGLSITSAQTDASCNGACDGSANVTLNGGTPPFTFGWLPSGGTNANATGLCAGTYTCSISDGTGCTSTQTFTITEPPAVTLAMSANVNICNGQNATISATPAGGTGPYVVSWSGGLPNGTSNTVTPASTTTYTATATDANGCTISQTVSVTVDPAPVPNFTLSAPGCAPWAFNLANTSTGATTYTWDFGDPLSGANNTSTLQNPSHLYLLPGSYNITLIAASPGGCADTITLTNAAVVYPQPIASIGITVATISEYAPTAVFTDLSSGGTNCITYFGDGDSIIGCNIGTFTHTYGMPGTYTVMQVATNANGCTDTTYVTVVVESESTIFIPNAFTPNGDEHNGMFYAYGTNIEEFQMLIYDRWGNLVYESKDIYKGWDGTYKGDPVQEDVYVWKIIYTDSRSKRHRAIGHVSVIR
ncbi:MAG: PKD domain-containing protein [Bacteroidetes bacterium]|nr:MAG: PKD domain-containing protein [Bacteroidota bacterium]